MADQRPPRFRLPWNSAPAPVRPAGPTARAPIRPPGMVTPPQPAALPPPRPTAETEPTPMPPLSQLLPPPTAAAQPPPPSRLDPQSQDTSQIASQSQIDQTLPTVTQLQDTSLPPPSTSKSDKTEPQPSSSTVQSITEPTPEPQKHKESLPQQGAQLSSSSDKKTLPDGGQELQHVDQNQPSSQEIERMAVIISATESDSKDQDHTKASEPQTILSGQVQEDIKADDAMDLKPLHESERKLEGPEEKIQLEQDISPARTKSLTPEEAEEKVVKDLSPKQDNGKEALVQNPNPETLERKDMLNDTATHTRFSEGARPTYHRVSSPLQRSAIPDDEKAPLHKQIKEDTSKLVHKLGSGKANQPPEDKPFSVITLAGENKGAIMHLGLEKSSREGFIHIQRGYKSNPDDESIESTTDGEGSREGRKSRGVKTEEDLGTKAYINSNVQSINNSLVLNSSINQSNPGVQLVLSQTHTEPVKQKKEMGTAETHKAEFSLAPPHNLTYNPTVRRRCLRGLFLESSDSDPNNPNRPRRHGCRVGCKEKNNNKI